MSKLAEILFQLQGKDSVLFMNHPDGHNIVMPTEELIVHGLEAKAEIIALVDEIIGEDEDVSEYSRADHPCTECGSPMDEITQSRLREQQRNRAKELLGEL